MQYPPQVRGIDRDQCHKPNDPRVSQAIYAGMRAYTKEANRLDKATTRVDPRPFLVAVRAYNAAMMEADDDIDVIEGDA